MSATQLLAIYIPAIGMLILVALANIFFHIPAPMLTGDIAAIANVHPLTGALSSLGAFLWCSTAAICFFSAAALHQHGAESTFKFLLYSALLSAYLCFDGFFSFHEYLARQYLGLNEKLVYLALAIFVASYLFVFKANISNSNFGMLLLALVLLSSSVGIDVMRGGWFRIPNRLMYYEDAAKWMGIVSWCGYYVDTCYRLLFQSAHTAGTNISTEIAVVSPRGILK